MFFQTDADDVVYEDLREANNVAELDTLFDVMPVAYSDLVVNSLSTPAIGAAGQVIEFTWTVENQGIGITNRGDWLDRAYLTLNSDGSNPIDGTEIQFSHYGQIAVGDSYVRTAQIPVPNGTGGNIFLVLETAAQDGPFEFIFGDNNRAVSSAISITQPPTPDLAVDSVTSPTSAEEDTDITVSWSVTNRGIGSADGTWVDRVYLKESGGTAVVELGTFDFTGPLSSGQSYLRSESISIPAQINNVFDVFVTTDFGDAVFEDGETSNNSLAALDTLSVSAMPRPDLQVLDVTIPNFVSAGSSLSVEFRIVNQGTVPTSVPNWVDRVYLSLDTTIDRNDILIDQLANRAALDSGEEYSSSTDSIVVPIRYRGEVYVIVSTDHHDIVQEWPNDDNNIFVEPITIDPIPLPDLVAHDVIAPSQAVSGSEIQISYSVTNLGTGETLTDTWADAIWLTRDKDRPSPAQGDLLLATHTHSGALDNNAGYDRTVEVTLPSNIESGTWYLTLWADPFDTVIEDTLAANTNADDPTQVDNNNYKAREILIIGAQPDLIVSEVQVPATATGGDEFTVTWTVANLGLADTLPGGWVDRIYLSDVVDPFAEGATTMLLGEKQRQRPLSLGASYTESLTIELSPSAAGQYIVVVTDDEVEPDTGIELPGFFGAVVPKPESYEPVAEVFEDNNATAVATSIVPAVANLTVTNIDLPSMIDSGEPLTINYTVTNTGSHAVWPGTKFWRDFIWLSADPAFIRDRASFLGEAVHVHDELLDPGQSYNVSFEATLPEGTNGDYFVYINLDAHNNLSPIFQPFQARQLLTDWYPASSGRNDVWLEHFGRWAFEDPSDNLAQVELPITFREADLQITSLQIPAGASSGDLVPVSYTVTNTGTRDTRANQWSDRIFISHDASLNTSDHELYESVRIGALAAGESYTANVNVRIPDGIEGDFHLIAFADSAAYEDPLERPSDIGFQLIGIQFEQPGSLAPYDLVSEAARAVSRGKVKEYQGEGNNLASATIPIALNPLPDLQVTSVTAPAIAPVGQRIDVSYTIENFGGATPPGQSSWNDLIYLSRDGYLDTKADIYLGKVDHSGGLGDSDRYSVDTAVKLPGGLDGSYFVFITTDQARKTVGGKVFEANERNNARPSNQPLIIEQPPPTDLQVTTVVVPSLAVTGEEAEISWTVTNTSGEPASGTWSDSVFLSADSSWDISDRAIGRADFSGTLAPGESYTSMLTARVPSVTPGAYRAIIRTDIFDQVHEDVGDANNTQTSEDVISIGAESIQLDVPVASTLSTGQERLFQISVPLDRTLRVTLTSSDVESATELYLRQGSAPTATKFDATSQGGLAAEQIAVIPSTEAGTYYVLVRGFAMPNLETPITLLAELVPLAITNISTDVGGDTKYVTTMIEGARFEPDAIVKMSRPGFAEFDPVAYDVVNATTIIATFDFESAPHGLYDVSVINPSGDRATIPYRFLVERAIEPEVTIGLGGPRYIFAGDTGTYSVALQNLGNIDSDYTYFTVGIPEMGIHENLYGLPYARFFSNVRGNPDIANLSQIPWAELNSEVNTNGTVETSGYVFNEPAAGFTGFTFDVSTYPGLRELHDHAFEQLKERLYAAFPEYAESNILATGPSALDVISPGLSLIWEVFGAIPSFLEIPFIPFQFHVVASATSMSRDEFVAQSLEEASTLREAVLEDDTASPSLATLAADEESWNAIYLMSLEDAGILQPESTVPPIRETPKIISLMATLASGILAGPAGGEITTTGDLVEFFNQIRRWYGHDPSLEAEIDPDAPTFQGDTLGAFGILQNVNPIPTFPSFEDYDLGLTNPTQFQAFRVYVPWVSFEARGGGIPADYQIHGITPDNENAFFPLNLDDYYDQSGVQSGAASLTGPFTLETDGFVPVKQPLPFTVNFQNDPVAPTHTSEVRIVTPLDENLDPRTFQLGDIRVGEITVHVPDGRGLFQGDFDFSEALGFLLRVSAGVDLQSNTATWLLQAIDPLTGELVQDPSKGLLPPNNAQGHGAGFVSYSIQASETGATGTTLVADARVLLNNLPPEDTQTLKYTLDAEAPTSQLEVDPVGTSEDFLVRWDVADDADGSGFKHVTLYVSEDGGTFRIWQRQLTDASGEDVYQGRVGHTYQFLALATDRAGNQEIPPVDATAEDDGTQSNLGGTPNVGGTSVPDFGQAPEPTSEPSTNPLFTQAELLVPSEASSLAPTAFRSVLQPFAAQAFATDFPTSAADIGPMAIIETSDGAILVSGGTSRNKIFRFDSAGGSANNRLLSELDYPIFNLVFDDDGRLWATTGGGPLLELNPNSGEIINEFGDGLTMGLAVDSNTGLIYVGSGRGVEMFDPNTEQFTHYSRDLDLRIGSVAFADDGSLWATTWPDRREVVRFNAQARAETLLSFDSPVDSLAFGKLGTQLEGLLFVSHNSGDDGSELTMVDAVSLRRVALARGGTRGDVVATTSDGRVLISQSSQVDALSPATVPTVLATNPANETIAALPRPFLTVTFDQEMFDGGYSNPASVTNADNYFLQNESGTVVAIQEVIYDATSDTATLRIGHREPNVYTLTISETIESAVGLPLGIPYTSSFTAVDEHTAFVDIEFSNTRLSRIDQTVAYEVEITNTGGYDLFLPTLLSLDPVTDIASVPLDVAARTEDGRWLISLEMNFPDGVRLRPGETTTARTVQILSPDFESGDFASGIVATSAQNQTPVFNNAAPTQVNAGQVYAFTPDATDPDGAVTAYLLGRGPDGMTVNEQTGEVIWPTNADSPAEALVSLHVFDGRGGFATLDWTINVIGGNRVPEFVPPLPDVVEMTESQTLFLPIAATDPDGDSLSIWAENLPPFATFDWSENSLIWNSGHETAGTYRDVMIFVSDGINTVSDSFDVLVSETDQAPMIDVPTIGLLREGVRSVIRFAASDADGDTIVFTSGNLPEGASLDPSSGRFEWTPPFHATGMHDLTITVSSNNQSVSETVSLNVLNANGAPTFDPLIGLTAVEGQEIRLPSVRVRSRQSRLHVTGQVERRIA